VYCGSLTMVLSHAQIEPLQDPPVLRPLAAGKGGAFSLASLGRRSRCVLGCGQREERWRSRKIIRPAAWVGIVRSTEIDDRRVVLEAEVNLSSTLVVRV
jgi:hypothetical protein